MTKKLIIDFTPTGMIPTKKLTPHVPVSVPEIVEDVHHACEVGITKVHIHARDPKTEEPTYKKEVYAEIIEGIRKFAPYMVICVSLSGRTFHKFEERSDALELDGSLKPDLGSLTLSSLNFNKIASVNAPEMIQKLAIRMKERGIVPELEAFHQELYKLYHYYNPANDEAKTRETVAAMVEKLEPLRAVTLPERLADRQGDFDVGVAALGEDVNALRAALDTGNREAVQAAVESVHSAYQAVEAIFD